MQHRLRYLAGTAHYSTRLICSGVRVRRTAEADHEFQVITCESRDQPKLYDVQLHAAIKLARTSCLYTLCGVFAASIASRHVALLI